MRYKSVFTKGFKREFKKLPKNVKERILDAILKAVTNPYVGTRLHGELQGLWRWRVGKYRLVYMINEKELLPYLDEGWNIVKELRNGKIVVRRKLM